MKKDCYSQEVVDARKFQECARCEIAEECVQTVYLKGARAASIVGRFLGYALAAAGLAIALSSWGDLPHGAPWLAFTALIYGLAVHRAGREYSVRNGEERERVDQQAEAKPAGQAAKDSHGAHH
jgi:hypothetical protein